MAYKMKTDIAHKSNYGSSRNVSKIKYIVIHYTANDGDTDEANANYFNGANKKASAHYFVDDDSVTQSVPDNYTAWSVGGGRYKNYRITGGAKYYGKCTNTNSISIELCDDIKNGTIYPSKKTIENAIELTKMLMKKYKVPSSNVIRHFDVTGKLCPAYWCGSSEKDLKWKTEFWNKLGGIIVTDSKITTSSSVSKIDTVKEVQNWANTNYKSGLSVDGIFGVKTKKALVKILQTELNQTYNAGLIVDGIFGAKTKKFCPTLKNGSNNDIVGILQAFLICNKINDVYVDGHYGLLTVSAVKTYQKKNGLVVDGIVGKNTFAKLCS